MTFQIKQLKGIIYSSLLSFTAVLAYFQNIWIPNPHVIFPHYFIGVSFTFNIQFQVQLLETVHFSKKKIKIFKISAVYVYMYNKNSAKDLLKKWTRGLEEAETQNFTNKGKNFFSRFLEVWLISTLNAKILIALYF